MIQSRFGIGNDKLTRIFKAAVLLKTNHPLQIFELIAPPLIPGQVLIRNLYSGVCRSQLMEINGHRGADKWLPHLLGHEAVGVVEEISETVSKIKVGDKVVLSWITGLGQRVKNPAFKDTDGRVINSGAVTTFSEYTITSECFVTLAPEGFDNTVLPLFGCAFLTGAGMAIRSIKRDHKKVAIIGFGGVGSAAAIASSIISKAELVIIEQSPSRRALAKKMGFENVTDALGANEYVGTVDLCIESGGTVSSIELGFKLLTKSGELVFASHPPNGQGIVLNPHELLGGKKIRGSWGGGGVLDVEVDLVAKILLRKTQNLNVLAGKIFGLDEINGAISYLQSSLPGRSLIQL